MSDAQDSEHFRAPNGRYSTIESEVKRLDQLYVEFTRATERLTAERDRRLDDRFKSQETATAAALAAAEKAVNAALTASKEAINKAETSQLRVNETQNEFRGTLRDQARELMPRGETENLVRELRSLISTQSSQIGELRSRLDIGPPSLGVLQARSDEGIGRSAASIDARSVVIAVVGLIIGIGGLVLAASP